MFDSHRSTLSIFFLLRQINGISFWQQTIQPLLVQTKVNCKDLGLIWLRIWSFPVLFTIYVWIHVSKFKNSWWRLFHFWVVCFGAQIPSFVIFIVYLVKMWRLSAILLITAHLINAFDDMPPLDPSISTVSPHVAPTSDSCVGELFFYGEGIFNDFKCFIE